MAVLALVMAVMASLACSVEWDGIESPTLSMTGSPSPAPSMTATIQPAKCLIVHALSDGEGALNLRKGPGTSYPVITALHDGQPLVMGRQAGNWYAVTVVMDGERLTGYVHSSYVEDCK